VLRRAQDSITLLLRQRHRIRPGAEDNFGVSNLSDLTSAFNEQTAIVSALLMVVASISLLVGGIGVMNIMLVSVTERTREIGIRLAIGARGRDILAQFLIEATTLAAIGGVAGIGSASSRACWWGGSRSSAWGSPRHRGALHGVSGGIGVIFGFFPARSRGAARPHRGAAEGVTGELVGFTPLVEAYRRPAATRRHPHRTAFYDGSCWHAPRSVLGSWRRRSISLRRTRSMRRAADGGVSCALGAGGDGRDVATSIDGRGQHAARCPGREGATGSGAAARRAAEAVGVSKYVTATGCGAGRNPAASPGR
jgi:hypothetical protein